MLGNASRTLALLSLLQTGRGWPGRVLAERLGVTPRTVRRDIDRLRELGYRIQATKGPDGGYRLGVGAELPPLLFDDAQALAVAVALQNAPSAGVDIEEAALRALATVRQVMPSRLRHRIDGMAFSGTEADVRVDPAVLEAVSVAARERHVLRFDYVDSDAPLRRVEPHNVVARKSRWYVIAWDLDRGDWRIFRLDKITPRSPTGPRFTPRTLPADDASTFLAARSKGSEREDRWPCTGEVIIDRPARDIAPWIGDGEFKEVTPDSCRLIIGSWSWTGLLAFMIRWDAPFTIVGPEPLIAAAKSLVARLDAAAEISSPGADSGQDSATIGETLPA